MKIHKLLPMILSLVLFISCSDDDENNCIDYEEVASVVATDAPETATVNEPVEIEVTFEVPNACGEFQEFTEEISGTTRTIEVVAEFEGCACAQVITSRSAIYTFTPGTTGEHLLRFRSDSQDFIEETILVEESATSEEE